MRGIKLTIFGLLFSSGCIQSEVNKTSSSIRTLDGLLDERYESIEKPIMLTNWAGSISRDKGIDLEEILEFQEFSNFQILKSKEENISKRLSLLANNMALESYFTENVTDETNRQVFIYYPIDKLIKKIDMTCNLRLKNELPVKLFFSYYSFKEISTKEFCKNMLVNFSFSDIKLYKIDNEIILRERLYELKQSLKSRIQKIKEVDGNQD